MKAKKIVAGLLITAGIGVLFWLGIRFGGRLLSLLTGRRYEWDNGEERMEVRVRLDEAPM